MLSRSFTLQVTKRFFALRNVFVLQSNVIKVNFQTGGDSGYTTHSQRVAKYKSRQIKIFRQHLNSYQKLVER